METSLPITVVFLIVLITGAQTKPTQGSCTLTDEDISDIKSAVQKASKAAVDDIVLDPTLIDKCPMLAKITASLKSVATEIVQMRDSAISTDQVDQLKQNFEDQVNQIVKSRDIFEKQSGTQATKEHGEMLERMTALQVKVTELEQQIAKQTASMYEDMAELIFQRLQMNSTESVRSYTKHMMEEKLEELMNKLETNYRIYLGALRFLNHMNDQELIGKVFDGILKRLGDMKADSDDVKENGRNLLVNLLCWTVNNDFLGKKYKERQVDLYRMALKFYPKTYEKAANEADVRSRQFCEANFPANLITWFAVSWNDRG